MRFFRALADVIKAARGRADSLTVGTAMAVVAFCSGFISFTHISALTQELGGSWKVAHLMPFCVDGQIVIGSSYFMYGESWKSKTAGLLFGVIPGIGESLIANWESGAGHGYWASGWDTVPAQAFACSMILFERWLHRRREQRAGVASALAAAPLAMARIAAELFPQAPEPVAPGPEPEVTACRDLRRALALSPRPEGAPWGLVSPAAAPVPPPVPAFPVPVLGPVMTLAQRPAARPRPVKAGDDRLPLPARPGDLAAALDGLSRNKIFETYRVSKGKAGTLVTARDSGGLAQWLEQYLDEREVA